MSTETLVATAQPTTVATDEKRFEESLPEYLNEDAHQKRVVVAGPMNTNEAEFKLFQALCSYLGRRQSPYLLVRDFAEYIYKNTGIKSSSNMENVVDYIGRFVGKLASKAVDLAFIMKRDADQTPSLVLLKTPGELTQTEMLVRMNHVLLQQLKHSDASKRFLSLEDCVRRAKLAPGALKKESVHSFELENLTQEGLEACVGDDRLVVVRYDRDLNIAYPSGRRYKPLEFWSHHLEKVHRHIQEEPFNYQMFRNLVGSQRLNWEDLKKIFDGIVGHNSPSAMQFINLFNKVEQAYEQEHREGSQRDFIGVYYLLSSPINAVLRHKRQANLKKNLEAQDQNDHFEAMVVHLLTAVRSKSTSKSVHHSLYAPMTLRELESVVVSSKTIGDLYDEEGLQSLLEPLLKSNHAIPPVISFVDRGVRYYLHRCRLISVVYSAIITERERLLHAFFGRKDIDKRQVNQSFLETFVDANASSMFKAIANVARLSLTSKEDGNLLDPETLMKLLFMRMSEAIRYKMRMSSLMVNEDGSPINKSQDLHVFVETLYDHGKQNLRPKTFAEVLNITPESMAEWRKETMPNASGASGIWGKVQELVDAIIRTMMDWLLAIFKPSAAAEEPSQSEALRQLQEQLKREKRVSKAASSTHGNGEITMESLLKIAPVLADHAATKQLLENSHDQWNTKVGDARTQLKEDVDELLFEITKRLTLRELDDSQAMDALVGNIVENNKAMKSLLNQKALKYYMKHKILYEQKLLLEAKRA